MANPSERPLMYFAFQGRKRKILNNEGEKIRHSFNAFVAMTMASTTEMAASK